MFVEGALFQVVLKGHQTEQHFAGSPYLTCTDLLIGARWFVFGAEGMAPSLRPSGVRCVSLDNAPVGCVPTKKGGEAPKSGLLRGRI